MPRSSGRKKGQAVSYKEESDGGSTDLEPGKASDAVIAKAKKGAAPKTTQTQAQTAAGKRGPPDAGAETGADGPERGARPAKKRKAKAADADQDAAPLAGRTAVSALAKPMYIGAHVSAAGGVHNAVSNAAHVGANSFALFLKPQRRWASAALTPEAREQFAARCGRLGYRAGEHALPHGSYLVNLAQADEAKAAQAYGSFVDDLRRCEQLGIGLYNLHPGAAGDQPREAAVARIAAQLNRAHAATASVVTLLENMAGGGTVVGAAWQDLRDIIALVDDKRRVGVCLDTCHAFAAGHDLRTPEAFARTMGAFDSIVGLQYLRAFHLNDSKAPFHSNRDLHANIGTGFLGLGAFHSIVNDDRFRNLPMVLETPIDRKDPSGKTVEDKQVWADEIKLLESLVGMDRDSDDFRRRQAELQDRGAAERARIQAQVDKKSAKEAGRGAAGRRRKKAPDSGDESG
ncbi:uncharacterized protein UV8b_04565 [Ustilaginoidea virens]|uniref:Apurinic-apyrimidinic endonuclease 1 n=1 Tax=Ustilaginoidea virens TaxID=1159556 RepID=A0A8E5HSF7_USTVR|nr:uncharacterized protein UV8b_04565 [Ustilaginoidea virens]QUC20324.1 hypothetical protein UV8b_04565 [Ustilaginoidea virens]